MSEEDTNRNLLSSEPDHCCRGNVLESGQITSELPGPVPGSVQMKRARLAAVSPGVLSPTEPEPTVVPS